MTTFLLVLVPAFGLRAFIAWMDYHAIDDALSGRTRALDEVRTANSLVLPSAILMIVAAILVSWTTWRWRRATYANALLHPEIGMRWMTQVRHGRAYAKARRVQIGSYLLLVVAGIAIRTPDHYDRQTIENISPLFLVQVVTGFLAVLATIELAVVARRMTRELMARVEDADLADRRRTTTASLA